MYMSQQDLNQSYWQGGPDRVIHEQFAEKCLGALEDHYKNGWLGGKRELEDTRDHLDRSNAINIIASCVGRADVEQVIGFLRDSLGTTWKRLLGNQKNQDKAFGKFEDVWKKNIQDVVKQAMRAKAKDVLNRKNDVEEVTEDDRIPKKRRKKRSVRPKKTLERMTNGKRVQLLCDSVASNAVLLSKFQEKTMDAHTLSEKLQAAYLEKNKDRRKTLLHCTRDFLISILNKREDGSNRLSRGGRQSLNEFIELQRTLLFTEEPKKKKEAF